MLYLLALRGGMRMVERHRHGLDIFPDCERSIPFGCGATVFYNYADLRFENPLTQPVLVRMWIEDGSLCGELRIPDFPGWTVEVYEEDHQFHRTANSWVRENRIRRRFVLEDGGVLLDQEVAHNIARVLYDPAEVNRCSALP
jgi:vancomycin resistance protein VanW